jgi:hypothetical protein
VARPLIDGRHRRRACDELGIPCAAREWRGDESEIISFVVSVNLRRRHLSESQRAMVAAKLATLPSGVHQGAQICAPSQSAAAEMLNVSRRSVQSAKRIREVAPILANHVERGALTLHGAGRTLVSELRKSAELEVALAHARIDAASRLRHPSMWPTLMARLTAVVEEIDAPGLVPPPPMEIGLRAKEALLRITEFLMTNVRTEHE